MTKLSQTDVTILLLDSDSVTRAALHDAFQSADYLVVTAGDLGEAVDRLDEIRPDLLITRPYISTMPGHIAANYLRSKHPGLPVLIVAGFVDDDRLNVPNEIEKFYTFPKPFSRDELLANVRDILQIVRSKG
jgi:DNA-binding NtrC family response regulator